MPGQFCMQYILIPLYLFTFIYFSGLFSCLTLIETCLACHIEHPNLVCNVYLSNGDKLYFNSNVFLFINYKFTCNYITK